MKTVTTSALLPCTPETFWKVYMDEPFLNALYLEALEYKAVTVIERNETSHKLLIVPTVKLPALIAKRVGDSFVYENHGTLNPERNEWAWQMVQPANLDPKRKPRKNAVKINGTVRIETEGTGHCRRTDDFSIEAKIFGLGARIESGIERELRSVRAKEYAFLTQWMKR